MKKKILMLIVFSTLSFCIFIPTNNAILDLQTLSQSLVAHISSVDMNIQRFPSPIQEKLAEKYKRILFSPWNQYKPSTTIKQIQAMVERYTSSNWHAENKKLKGQSELTKLKVLCNLDHYPNNKRNAITIRNTSLRLLPTNKPHFYDFNKAGEGFPFDMLQNSGIPLNTPLFICHISADRAWVFAESAYASGWLPINDIAYTSERLEYYWKRRMFLTPVDDELTLIDTNGKYHGTTRIGALIPKAENHFFIISDLIDWLIPNNDYIEVLAIEADQDHQGNFVICKVPFDKLKPWPLQSTMLNIAKLADKMMGQTYGWGDLFGNRDCSSTLKDLFAGFGRWIPRNGNDQAKSGKFINLNGLPVDEKLSIIRSQGIPMASLLWFRGHIMLYIGLDKANNPLIFHNVWGLRVFSDVEEEGRLVIGQTVITTIEAGKERSDLKSNWLKRMEGLILL